MILPDIRNMKALSIRQPWPHRIFHEGKDIENRTWPTRYRGLFLIHAGKTFDGAKADSEGYDIGGIVGFAELVDCVTESDSPWFMGGHGFVLRNAIALPAMIPCKGALGFFLPDQMGLGWAMAEMVDDGDMTTAQMAALMGKPEPEMTKLLAGLRTK